MLFYITYATNAYVYNHLDEPGTHSSRNYEVRELIDQSISWGEFEVYYTHNSPATMCVGVLDPTCSTFIPRRE